MATLLESPLFANLKEHIRHRIANKCSLKVIADDLRKLFPNDNGLRFELNLYDMNVVLFLLILVLKNHIVLF